MYILFCQYLSSSPCTIITLILVHSSSSSTTSSIKLKLSDNTALVVQVMCSVVWEVGMSVSM